MDGLARGLHPYLSLIPFLDDALRAEEGPDRVYEREQRNCGAAHSWDGVQL